MCIRDSCRTIPELSYSQEVINESNNDEIIKEFITNKLITYHSTTREKFINNGRITELLNTKKIFKDLEIEDISSNDRFMFCGSMGLNNDLKTLMIKHNLKEGANNNPAEFVLEKAFVG